MILAYQPWFLSPSRNPLLHFCKVRKGKRLLKGKLVIIPARLPEYVDQCAGENKTLPAAGWCQIGREYRAGGQEPQPCILITIIRWATKGKKRPSFIPARRCTGKRDHRIGRFAGPILQALEQNNYDQLHTQLLALESVRLKKPSLVVLEFRGVKPFRFWANYISEKGGLGDAGRQGRVSM